ncbi:MAG: Mth938-like domain-containing protein [Janthinobacterium lividum]
MTAGFEPQRPADTLLVEGYAGRGFRVDGRAWPDGVLVTPEAAFDFAALDLAGFEPLTRADPPIDVVLIGTGPTMRRPPRELLDALRTRGTAAEFMDSRAAARTYNVLAGEGRRVAAALLPLR